MVMVMMVTVLVVVIVVVIDLDLGGLHSRGRARKQAKAQGPTHAASSELMSSASVLVLTSVHLHPPARRAATTNSTPTARTPTTPRAAYCACIRGIQRPPPAVRPPTPSPFEPPTRNYHLLLCRCCCCCCRRRVVSPSWHMGLEPSSAGHNTAAGLVFPMG